MGSAILPARLWQVAVPAFAALVGIVAGVSPTLGIAAALGAAYASIVLTDIAVGVALFVALAFLESISAASGLSLAKAAGGLLALSWAALVATRGGRGRQLARDHPVATGAIVVLGAWVAMSAAWAEIPAAAFDAASRWILNLLLLPIVYVAVREPRHVRWVFTLFILGALLSAGIGITGASSGASGADRLGGSGVNANELGELLIVSVVLATTLGVSRSLAPPLRVLAFVASGLSLLALLATVSRGAMVGLAVALLLTPLLIGSRRRLLSVGLVVLAVGGAVTYLVAIAPTADLQRITQSDGSGTGRVDIWKVGWRMVEDNPVAGVGAGNYANSTVHYLFDAGELERSDFIVDDPKPTHNVYLQALAELGVVGLALFLSILAFSLRSLLRAAWAFRRAGDRTMEVLSRGLLIALCGLLASAFFSTAIYSKQLWLLLGVSVALSAMAAERRPLSARTR